MTKHKLVKMLKMYLKYPEIQWVLISLIIIISKILRKLIKCDNNVLILYKIIYIKYKLILVLNINLN